MQDPSGNQQGSANPVNDAPPEDLSLMSEFFLFLRENKKWWLMPIVLMVVLLGSLLLLSSTPIAPFIYSLF